jgi:hypothetical protein
MLDEPVEHLSQLGDLELAGAIAVHEQKEAACGGAARVDALPVHE